MIKLLFLLLLLMSSAAFAQTTEKPRAVKFDEFEAATDGNVKMKMDAFYVELNNNPSAQGYIINYGTEREIAIRRKQISLSIAWRKFDGSRITNVDGGFRDGVKSELWVIPSGADNPPVDSVSKKIDEFGKTPNDELKARIQGFYVSLSQNSKLKGYILIYGSPATIASQKAQIQNVIRNFKLDSSRVSFKNAGFEKAVKTEFWVIPANDKNNSKTKIWIVPPGAKPPVQ